MADWSTRLKNWKAQHHCRVLPPVEVSVIEATEDSLGSLPPDLAAFYGAANGLAAEAIRVLPIEDSADPKRTWDSVGRANDPSKTRFLGRDADLLERFLIFAVLEGDSVAAFDRADGSIWYEEAGELHQTDLTLEDFIDRVLRESA
jgi:hypothetical protein